MMITTETQHIGGLHGTIDCHTMMKRHVLTARFGAVEEYLASLFQLFNGLSSLCGSAEN